jgi:hypothetical protein
MHRIDNPSASTALPTPKPAGPDGYFTAGNPNTGQPATIVEYDWMNTVQEELASIVLKGGLTFDKTNNGQVLTALGAMLTGAFVYVNVTQDIPVPAWATRIEVEVVGAGGGGAHCQSNGTSYVAGAGGGAGAYVAAQRPVAPGAIIHAIIGIGGGSDAAGTSSSLASAGNWTLTCGGGAGGTWTTTSNCAGGQGGIASGGDLNANGAWGGDGQAAGFYATTGYGANSVFGGASRSGNEGSAPATGPGSGAGGVYDNQNQNSYMYGGTGANGIIKYRWLP